MSNFEKDAKNMTGTVAKEGYEASVGARALARAGKCPNLKGHVHEQIFCDKFNMNPRNILEGNHAQLTKSTTAKMKDVVVLNKKGQVVKHFQLKDTTSSSGVAKTSKQIIEKHYGKTKVMGTEETAKKVADKIANKTNQKIHSTNISTKTTTRIADKALGKMPTAAALRSAAKSGGVSGAVFGAGIEAVSSVIDVVDGKKDVDDAVIDIAGAGIKGGVTGAAAAAAGSAAAGAAGAAVAAVTGTTVGGALAATTVGAATVVAAPVVIGFAAACAVGSFISDLFD
ncbi:hypothetical protein [Megasphaera sp.]|uniref:hypothetical protein n=1 Tax=Megasphaera sp. TaxID=2023260 RepID=UPI003A93E2F1